jgi:hypothetical protein
MKIQTIGLVYVAFGKECDRLAAHCIGFSRQYTKLPILVLSNIPPGQRDTRWQSIEGVTFHFIDLQVDANREIKTTVYKWTDFDFSIYMDADSFIQKPTFDKTMKWLISKEPDIILNHYVEYPYEDGRFQNIYLRALNQFGAKMPLQIYNGAFIGFKKNNRTTTFFDTWNRYWREFGSQREMPPLACAINRQSNLKTINLPFGFFAGHEKNNDAVVQHNYWNDFFQRLGIEPIQMAVAKYRPDDYSFTVLDKNWRDVLYIPPPAPDGSSKEPSPNIPPPPKTFNAKEHDVAREEWLKKN